jgi:type I restriction enzyme S subunit
MRSNYKKLGNYIQQVNVRNIDGKVEKLVGVNLDKKFMPSVANIIGADLTKYKVIKKGQFGCKFMSVGRDGKLPISLMQKYDEAIISSAYYVFEVKDENELLSEYLMMWLSRSENDRYLWFISGADVRGSISWNDFCSIDINIPPIEKQREIVKEYHTIVDRIKLNEQLNQKLEETAQSIYKEWFLTNDIKTTIEELNDLSVAVVDNRGKTPKWTSKGIPLVEANAINTNQPFVDLSKVQKFVTNEVYLNSFRSGHPKEKDILIVTVGSSIGSLAIASNEIFSIAQNIISIRPKDGFSHYLFETLKYKKSDLLSLDIGSAQSSIKVPHLLSMSIDLPDKELLFKFEDIASKLYGKVFINQKQVVKLYQLKEILLSKMATIKD